MNFYNITKFDEIQEFHNITPIDNISSIIKDGLLCHDLACKIDFVFVTGAYVRNKHDKKELIDKGFDKEIIVNEEIFFGG